MAKSTSYGCLWLLIRWIVLYIRMYIFVLDRMPYNHAIWHLFVMEAA
ncbi:MAG: hypothetical protein ACLU4S_04475 [Clostridium perfringens]